MGADRFHTRCLGCGKWTRRSRCAACRAERRREQIDPNGREARRMRRQQRAKGHPQ